MEIVKPEKKKSKNYIENETLYTQIKDWKTEYDKAMEETEQGIPVSDELTRSILLIATRTATRYNFSGYVFRDDMIQDAMYVILKYIKNYDLEKTNPHAYITSCCWNAFVNRINIEKKSVIKKYKHYVNFVETNADVLARENAGSIDYEIVDQMYGRINDYESKPIPETNEDLSKLPQFDKHGNKNLNEFF